MYRKIIHDLKRWKYSPYRKPLILQGARQTGKTWIMKEFGKTEYENTAYLFCQENPALESLFNVPFNKERLLTGFQMLCGFKIEPENTLVILDEIQEIPKALTALKFLYEQAPEYHIICAGSLLGISLHEDISFPVGKVNFLNLYPLSLSEFLTALGKEQQADLINNTEQDSKLLKVFSEDFKELLKYYFFIGGMPEVVSTWIETQDFNKVRRVQKELLITYEHDISKHTTPEMANKIKQIWASVPSQLAKENKKFLYGVIRQGARAREYELAIQWLIDAGIVQKVSRVKEVHAPLKFYEDLTAFKLFLLDCGLFACMAGAPVQQMIVNNDVFKEFKGAFTEQFVLQQLTALGLQPYYWSSTSTPAEIDFVVQTPLRTIPIEVKAEENVRAKSLKTYVERHPEYGLKGLRISMLGYENQTWMEDIPLYGIQKYFASCTPQAPFSPRKVCE